MRSLRRSPAKHIDLLAQDQVFRFQRCSRLEARSQDTENQPEQIGHQDASLRRPLAASTPNRIFGTHRCLRLTMYLATLVWPISIPSLSNSPWIRGAPHRGLAMLISRTSRRISTATVGRPERGRDFQRQYDLNPARCQRTTVSGFTIVSALRVLGANLVSPTKIRRSMGTESQSLWQVPSLDVKLMTKDQDLSFQRGPRLEQ